MTLMADLVEKRGVLDNTTKKLKEALTEGGPDMDLSKIKSLEGDDNAKIDAIRALKEKETDLGKEVDRLAQAVKDLQPPKGDDDQGGFRHKDANATGGDLSDDEPKRQKSIGEMFVKSPAYLERQGSNGPVGKLDVPTVSGMKTLMTTTAGWAPQSLRTGLVVPNAQKPIQVIDLIPMGRTGYQSIVYMEETTFTNSAAETAEAGTYPESALALTQRTSPVQKIATFLPVTDEQLEDVEGIQSYVDNRLQFMLRQRLDLQLVSGNGSAPNLKGLLNVSGIQTQAKGSDPTPDAFFKAMTLIRTGTGQANPDTIIMNPTDWQNVKLLRTSQGVYIWGNPADNAPDRLWGMSVAMSQQLTAGTGIVMDSSFTELVMRKDIEVQVSNSHSTFFIEGKQAIRADVRCAFVVYRPAAVCTVTGL